MFGLGGVVIEGSRWKQLDRGFLQLKRDFFRNELRQLETLRGIRAERFEPKNLKNRRDERFALKVLELIERLGGRLIGCGCHKRVGVESHDDRALYTSIAQGVLVQLNKIMRQKARHRGQALIIMDQRNEKLNDIVLGSCQSFLFSNPSIDRIVETPLLVPSQWYHGVQIADVVGRIIAAVYRWRLCETSKCRRPANQLGPLVDRLTVRMEHWTSIWIPDRRRYPSSDL